ncbi:MAG: TRAP transporter large permease subunit [Alphaproteobacteria bacterium]|nr:TRAP transporter large permease subunit [Alphaproteobacteria bacterium]
MWFGIFVFIMTELALITPPIGINVYVMHNMAPEVPLQDIFMGVMPFVLVTLVFVVLLAAVPELALFLPRFAFG